MRSSDNIHSSPVSSCSYCCFLHCRCLDDLDSSFDSQILKPWLKFHSACGLEPDLERTIDIARSCCCKPSFHNKKKRNPWILFINKDTDFGSKVSASVSNNRNMFRPNRQMLANAELCILPFLDFSLGKISWWNYRKYVFLGPSSFQISPKYTFVRSKVSPDRTISAEFYNGG